ncbi:MAG: protein kinase, partial [Actinomycetota bacterium]
RDAIAGYRLDDQVARGRSGVVHRALAADGRAVAIKIHDRSDDGRREASRLAAVDHPGVVRLVGDGELDDGRVWIALEWIDGATLADLTAGAARVPDDRARRIVSQLAAALDALHDAGIVHGDVSPRNVIVGVDDVVTLVDLGASTIVGAGSTVDETTGLEVDTTPRYAAPEVARGGSPTAASDRYALGLIAYELLTGRFPFPEVATPIAMLGHHASSEPIAPSEHRPELGRGVETTLLTALSKDPFDRPPRAAAFAAALSDRSVGADPAGLPERGRSSRRRAVVVIAAAALALVGVFGVVTVPDGGRELAGDVGVGPTTEVTPTVPVSSASTTPTATDPPSTVSASTAPAASDPPSTEPSITSTSSRPPAASTPTPASTTAPATTLPATADPQTPFVGRVDDWPAGTAAALRCNLLEVPGFETSQLPDGFYGLDPTNTTTLAPESGVDGSNALRVGSTGAYGIFAEIVPLGPERRHVFSAWVRRVSGAEVTAFHVDYLDADFRQITFSREAAMAEPSVGDDVGQRVTVFATAPAAALYAIPSILKDGSAGSLVVDEAVFGAADGCPDLTP